MYHFLVRSGGWTDASDSLPAERVFEHTEQRLVQQFKPGGELATPLVVSLPALFVPEIATGDPQFGRVGTIIRARASARQIVLQYTYDESVSPIPMPEIERMALDLGIDPFELRRTHWAIKDEDLFRWLYQDRQFRLLDHEGLSPRRQPRIFQLTDPERTEDDLIALMMPFDRRFEAVHAAIRRAADELGLRCQRADDIWDHDAVIQDIVSLIDRSRVVICDCTGKNPNVFYEAGIAHALGRDVILITQSEDDIPFDLRHLRYVQYLDNGEGLNDLVARISPRLKTLAS